MGPTAKHGSLQLGCPSLAWEPLIWGDEATSRQEWREKPESWWSGVGWVSQGSLGQIRARALSFHKCHPRVLAHSGLSITILPLPFWFKCILVIH